MNVIEFGLTFNLIHGNIIELFSKDNGISFYLLSNINIEFNSNAMLMIIM
jgi:hypothetical protein